MTATIKRQGNLLMKNKINIIGLGNMGSALVTSSINTNFEIIGFDISSSIGPASQNNFRRVDNIDEILENGLDTILAVKPHTIKTIVEKIPDDRTIISIAAGIETSIIKQASQHNNPVIRVMPNTPMQIKKGVSVLFATSDAPEEKKNLYLDFFQNTGTAFYIDKEEMMHAITSISGSGPAYVYLFISAMENAGVSLGLPRNEARKLAIQTVIGAGELLNQKNIEPELAIHEVTSPGGTTIDAILTMKKEGIENAIYQGIKSAWEKSQKLSK